MSVNYQTEQKKLEEFKPEDASKYWKASAGQHAITALGELEDAEPYNDTPQMKLRIKINKNGEEKEWNFSKGKSLASTYGQLVALANKRNGTLLNQEFVVVVVFDGTKNSYTIV